MQENQISHLFGTFPLLTEENMASCSRGFWKPENAEEEKKLIENATPNTCVQLNGERHPSRSLYIMVCGIQRFLEEKNGSDDSLLMDKNEYIAR